MPFPASELSINHFFSTSKILLCADYTGEKGWPKELKAEMGWGSGKKKNPGYLVPPALLSLTNKQRDGRAELCEVW